MFPRLRCLLGRHRWVRIGSAPAVLITYDNSNKSWSTQAGTFIPREIGREGFVVLLECRHCEVEVGRIVTATKERRVSAAYARSYIEDDEKGFIRKGDT